MTRRRKLCILIPTHWEALMGGSQYQAKILIEKLIELDRWDIHYVARWTDPSFSPEGYAIHTIDGRRRLGGTYLQDVPAVWRILRRLRPDVIYQRIGCAHTGVAARYARACNKRLVWHVASDNNLLPKKGRRGVSAPLRSLERSLLDYGIRNASAVVAQTRHQERLLRTRYGRAAAAVVSNFHPEPDGPCRKSDERIRVCWIANMKALKRPDLFVRLAEACRKMTNVEFVMAGSPAPGMPGWQDLLDRVRAAGNVTYLGSRSQDAVNELLSSAHLLVNTSEYEGFPNTFVQAWLREVPVLSLAVNPDDAFAQGSLGVCAGGDYEKLENELQSLIRQPERRRRMGAEARRHARKHHSEGNVGKLISLLEEPDPPMTADARVPV